MKNTVKILVEMELPADTDPSCVLADMQEYACEQWENAEWEDLDDDDGNPELPDWEAIENAVSVEVVTKKAA